MKGIGLLMSVLQLDSNNRKALNYLGLFSMESRQFDRAIMRFKHLTELGPDKDPNYPYYYRYLAQAYMETGKKDEARASLETYKTLVKEQGLKTEADSLIQSIK
jgi:cytochrome c-type biogenesis protein CcmH/NrfG